MKKTILLLAIFAASGLSAQTENSQETAADPSEGPAMNADAPKPANKEKKKNLKSLFADMDVATRIQLMKQFDKDGDGRLNAKERAEAEKAMKDKSADLEQMRQKHAAEIIKKFDLDGDEKLNQKEMSAFLEEQRKIFEKNREKMEGRRGKFKPSKEILAKYDKNGDGKIDKEERAAIRKDMQARRQAFINKYDKDGDGRLNPEEAKAATQDPEVQEMVSRMMGNNPPPPPPPPPHED